MPAQKPDAGGSDWYIVVDLPADPAGDRADLDELPENVHTSLLVYAVQASSEEEAVAKLLPVVPETTVNFVVAIGRFISRDGVST